MLIEELQRQLTGQALAPPDPKAHAHRYRLLPKDLRRIVNALYRQGGTMDYGELASQTGCTLSTIDALQRHGMLYALPSPREPQRVVMPLELLFATPLAENDPDTLIETLKGLATRTLEAVAARLGIPGADELRLRALVYRHVAGGGTLAGLGEPALELLRWFWSHDWKAGLKETLKQSGAPPKARLLQIRELLDPTRPDGGALGELAGRFLLIPADPGPGVCVPRELRERVVEALRQPTASAPARCLSGRTPKYDSREGTLRGDLTRFLLLVEQDPPAITQKGTLNRVDMGRISRRAGLEEEFMERLSRLAIWMELLAVREGVTLVDPSAAVLLSKSPADFARALAGRFKQWSVRPPGSWLDPGTLQKVGEAVRSELLSTLTGPEATACLHCISEAAARSKPFKKLSRWQSEDPLRTSGQFLGAHVGLLHDLGFVGVELRESGVASIRWTATGAGAFSKAPPPTAPAETDGSIVVQPTGEIIAPFGMPFADLARLARAAEVKSVDAVAVFSLTRASVLRSAQRGEDPRRLKEFLASRSRTPLPQPVAFLLEEVGARMGEVEVLPCSALVRIRNPVLMKSLGFDLEPISEGLALLPPGLSPERLEGALRKAGYLPTAKPPEPAAAEGRPAAVDEGPALTAEEEFHEACDCETPAFTAAGIRRRLEHAEDGVEQVEIVIRGGRREVFYVDALDGDRVEGTDEERGRRVAVSTSSIVQARVIRED